MLPTPRKGPRMNVYAQLTQEQRCQIYAFKKAGSTQSAIAQELKVHKSTISRELRRNTGQRNYRPKQAQELANSRQRDRADRTHISSKTWGTRDTIPILATLKSYLGGNYGHNIYFSNP